MSKHYNVRVTVEEVTDPNLEPSRRDFGSPKVVTGKQVLQLVEFKTQRPTAESAAKAAIGAINLAVVESEDTK